MAVPKTVLHLTVLLFCTAVVSADKLDDLLVKHQSYCGTNIHREADSSNSSSNSSISNNSSSSNDTGSYRIVGGTSADRFEFPWQVSLRRWSPKAQRWFHTCGGALIDNSFILTAAHCTLGANATADQFMVRLGEYDYSKREGDEIDVNVSRILSHTGFNLSTIDHDINLIKLAQPLQLNTTSKLVPICVGKQPAEKSRETEERGCYSTGWGRLKFEGEFPKILQKVPVKWVEQETCQKAYEEHVNVTAGMICNGQLNAGTCS
ncbi:PREDICTED: chymotrypsin-like protease CTRL-1, partial [Rhagoletis zephyria]|uniref:chymotrypsin-like protease CTRL-1 n=1 Tax=Rhagoletis zephyria TaxID=28612 RepID=UPI0008117860